MMARLLDHDESKAVLNHFEIDVFEGRRQTGQSIVISGSSAKGAESSISVAIGTHTAQRLCPVTEFLAEGLVAELKEPHLKAESQAGRTIAHLIVKLSRMHCDSPLNSFKLMVLLEGDHYEVLPNSIAIDAPDNLVIPHRLDPHAHDRRAPHAPQRQH